MAARALATTPNVVEEETVQGPTDEQIRQRAYEIYVIRGYVDGCDTEDWLQAEAELRQASAGV